MGGKDSPFPIGYAIFQSRCEYFSADQRYLGLVCIHGWAIELPTPLERVAFGLYKRRLKVDQFWYYHMLCFPPYSSPLVSSSVDFSSFIHYLSVCFYISSITLNRYYVYILQRISAVFVAVPVCKFH